MLSIIGQALFNALFLNSLVIISYLEERPDQEVLRPVSEPGAAPGLPVAGFLGAFAVLGTYMQLAWHDTLSTTSSQLFPSTAP